MISPVWESTRDRCDQLLPATGSMLSDVPHLPPLRINETERSTDISDEMNDFLDSAYIDNHFASNNLNIASAFQLHSPDNLYGNMYSINDNFLQTSPAGGVHMSNLMTKDQRQADGKSAYSQGRSFPGILQGVPRPFGQIVRQDISTVSPNVPDIESSLPTVVSLGNNLNLPAANFPSLSTKCLIIEDGKICSEHLTTNNYRKHFAHDHKKDCLLTSKLIPSSTLSDKNFVAVTPDAVVSLRGRTVSHDMRKPNIPMERR
ncbi:hypothetical protein GYMLUDRAFT_243759 [Collybiopsis luxurians FD-317 M1]|uniref:Uncharacterized protein n=1 Tax=Collybiopsis luxurians FD-317 M1 TaxID=944289 RepID=A0A0D0CET5_9AGAR|nr:hypothetical protein GYMLUDRAFT_243759 [Collybiopsis luxurians FD-317 M1]